MLSMLRLFLFGSLLLVGGAATAASITSLVIDFEGYATGYEYPPYYGDEFPEFYDVEGVSVQGKVVLTFRDGFTVPEAPFYAGGYDPFIFPDNPYFLPPEFYDITDSTVSLVFGDPFLDEQFGHWDGCPHSLQCDLTYTSEDSVRFDGYHDPDDIVLRISDGTGSWGRTTEGFVSALGPGIGGVVTSAQAQFVSEDPVPEPSAALVFGLGLIGFAAQRRLAH